MVQKALFLFFNANGVQSHTHMYIHPQPSPPSPSPPTNAIKIKNIETQHQPLCFWFPIYSFLLVQYRDDVSLLSPPSPASNITHTHISRNSGTIAFNNSIILMQTQTMYDIGRTVHQPHHIRVDTKRESPEYIYHWRARHKNACAHHLLHLVDQQRPHRHRPHRPPTPQL